MSAKCQKRTFWYAEIAILSSASGRHLPAAFAIGACLPSPGGLRRKDLGFLRPVPTGTALLRPSPHDQPQRQTPS